MSILAQLINYTKNPTLETNFTVKNKVWFLIKFAGFFFLMSFLVGIPQEPLLKIVGFEAKDHFINQAISQDPYWQVFISTVLFAPFFEEISYRLWLRPTFKNLTLGLGILFSTIIGPLIPLGWIFFNLPILSVEIFTIIYFLLVSVVSISLVGVLLLIFGTTKKLNSFTSKHFKVFYYLSIVLFAFVHSFNYDISKVWFIIPIIILPQLLLGLYFGFVRMNLGLKWSIIAHSLHNFL